MGLVRHYKGLGCVCKSYPFNANGPIDGNPFRKGLGSTASEIQVGATLGGSALAAGLIASSAVTGPVGLALGSAVMAIGAIGSLFQPDYTKIDASNIVNQTAQLMQNNLSAWQALPVNLKVSGVQQFFISNYVTLWNALVQGCSNPQLGTSGQNCISEREPNGKYPFASYYLNPIQNDPTVTTQLTTVTFQDPLTGVNVTIQGPTATASTVTAVASGVTNAATSLVSSAASGNVESDLILGVGVFALIWLVSKIL